MGKAMCLDDDLRVQYGLGGTMKKLLKSIWLVSIVMLAMAPTTLADSDLAGSFPHARPGVGIAWGIASNEAVASVAEWAYDWGASESRTGQTFEYVPMVGGWGGCSAFNSATVSEFARRHPESYWLVFNEPNDPYQANCSPLDAADMFKELEDTVYAVDKYAKLIVGGVGNCGTTAPFDWLDAFIAAYEDKYGDLRVTGWHFHYYPGCDGAASATIFYNRTVEHVEAWRRWLNRPDNYERGHELWLTEFGAWNCQGNDYSNCNSDQDYMKATVPFLNHRVTRYAWFATHTCHSPIYWNCGNLLDRAGPCYPYCNHPEYSNARTALGDLYVSLWDDEQPHQVLLPFISK
jgi:hypothetical protein